LKCRSLADLCRGWGLDSEDLAQEFVMRMARPGGPPESVDEPARPRFGTRASAYLQRSLHNLAIDVQRRISREQAVLRSAAAEARLRPPSEPLSRMLAGRAFESMLEPLPRDVAVVLRLHFEDNLSFRHIADRLDLTLDAARARYYRGVNRLRQSLSVALGLNGRNRSRRSR
jgi:RNA polymerase sigma factor (sigma-70 family)